MTIRTHRPCRKALKQHRARRRHSYGRPWERVKEAFKAECSDRAFVCAVPGCNEFERLQYDHIIAYADGGTDEFENIQPLCVPHHEMKTRLVEIQGMSPDAAMEAMAE